MAEANLAVPEVLPAVPPAELSHADQEGLVLVGEAEDFKVTSNETYEEAGTRLLTVKTYIKRVGALLDPIVAATHAAWQVALEQRRGLLVHAEQAEGHYKGQMEGWATKLENERKAAEAEAERIRLAAEAEAQRIANEETERRRKEAEEKRTKEAEAARIAGDMSRAARIAETPVVVQPAAPRPVFTPVPLAPAAPPRVAGISHRPTYSAEVTDIVALCQAVVDGKVAKNAVMPNQKVLDGLARALKGELKIPGVKLVEGKSTAAKA